MRLRTVVSLLAFLLLCLPSPAASAYFDLGSYHFTWKGQKYNATYTRQDEWVTFDDFTKGDSCPEGAWPAVYPEGVDSALFAAHFQKNTDCWLNGIRERNAPLSNGTLDEERALWTWRWNGEEQRILYRDWPERFPWVSDSAFLPDIGTCMTKTSDGWSHLSYNVHHAQKPSCCMTVEGVDVRKADSTTERPTESFTSTQPEGLPTASPTTSLPEETTDEPTKSPTGSSTTALPEETTEGSPEESSTTIPEGTTQGQSEASKDSPTESSHATAEAPMDPSTESPTTALPDETTESPAESPATESSAVHDLGSYTFTWKGKQYNASYTRQDNAINFDEFANGDGCPEGAWPAVYPEGVDSALFAARFENDTDCWLNGIRDQNAPLSNGYIEKERDLWTWRWNGENQTILYTDWPQGFPWVSDADFLPDIGTCMTKTPEGWAHLSYNVHHAQKPSCCMTVEGVDFRKSAVKTTTESTEVIAPTLPTTIPTEAATEIPATTFPEETTEEPAETSTPELSKLPDESTVSSTDSSTTTMPDGTTETPIDASTESPTTAHPEETTESPSESTPAASSVVHNLGTYQFTWKGKQYNARYTRQDKMVNFEDFANGEACSTGAWPAVYPEGVDSALFAARFENNTDCWLNGIRDQNAPLSNGYIEKERDLWTWRWNGENQTILYTDWPQGFPWVNDSAFLPDIGTCMTKTPDGWAHLSYNVHHAEKPACCMTVEGVEEKKTESTSEQSKESSESALTEGDFTG